MRLHDQLIDLNKKTVNDNVNLKVSLLSLKISTDVFYIIPCCSKVIGKYVKITYSL